MSPTHVVVPQKPEQEHIPYLHSLESSGPQRRHDLSTAAERESVWVTDSARGLCDLIQRELKTEASSRQPTEPASIAEPREIRDLGFLRLQKTNA